jgi:hypothetical protein
MGWAIELLVLESRFGYQFSPLHVVQTGSAAHTAIYPMGTGGSFPKRENDHSPPTNAKVKKTWIYTSTAPYAFMA